MLRVENEALRLQVEKHKTIEKKYIDLKLKQRHLLEAFTLGE